MRTIPRGSRFGAALFESVQLPPGLGQVRLLLGVRMPRRPHPFTPKGGIVERVKSWFTDWILYFTALVASVTAVGAGGILVPISQPLTSEPVIWVDDMGCILQPFAVPFMIAAGVMGLIAIMHAVRGLGKLHGAYAKSMLVGDFTDATQ